MEELADVPEAETEAKFSTGMKRKRIRGRFRATLAGLLELEVLRFRHKEMVATALGKCKNPDYSVNQELQHGHRCYWVEESSFRLKLKRSLSQENLMDTGDIKSFLDLKRDDYSSEDLQQLNCPAKPVSAIEDRCSRASSGFCGSDPGGICSSSCEYDAVRSLATSMASLNNQGAGSDAGYIGHEDTIQWHSISSKRERREEARMKSDKAPQAFSEEVIPEAVFLSVVELYPDSHWLDVSDILQLQIILEPSYHSDLKSLQGSEVYRYPSPLHAVALQSPLYAPQSPTKHLRRNGRSSQHFNSSTLNSSLPQRPDSVPMQRVSDHACCQSESTSMLQSSMSLPLLQSSWIGKQTPSENSRCVEIILKRAQGQPRTTTAKNGEGIQSWSRRSMTSLHRTCSMGKSKASTHFKLEHFQSRDTSASASELASPLVPPVGFRRHLGTHKNRLRRHTAALTNLNIFRESKSTSVMRGTFLDRCCSIRASGERKALLRGHSSEVNMAKQLEKNLCPVDILGPSKDSSVL